MNSITEETPDNGGTRNSRGMSVEDKTAIKQGLKTGCAGFSKFADKFAEIIFIVCLLTAAGLKLFWIFASGDPDMKPFSSII